MICFDRQHPTFVVHCDQADEVFLAGDFNNWQVPGVPMRRAAADTWELEHPIAPGLQRVGYFAIQWRRISPGGPAVVHSGWWLDEYDVLVVSSEEDRLELELGASI